MRAKWIKSGHLALPTIAVIGVLAGVLSPRSAAAQAPPAPALVSPTGSGIAATPTYTWNAADTAVDYYLWVNGPTGAPVVQTWHAASDVCTGSVCAVTPATSLARGAHVWWVQARNGSGDGPWSAGMSFTVGALPVTPTLVSPQGSGVSTTPTYTWTAAADTDEYSIQVNDASGTPALQSRFPAAGVCSTICALTPPTALALGSHTWWVRGHNSSGDGPWSAGLSFVVGTVPSAPTLIAPAGSGVPVSPAFSWSAVADATAYELWVNGPSGSPTIHETYDTAAACSGAECTASPGVVLPPGAHTWWVRARNGSGDGSWSAGLRFTVGTLPTAPTLIAPTGADAAESPVFTWAFEPEVTDYYLWVNGPAGTPVIQTWYSAASVCAGEQCTVTAPVALDRGAHVWWIQGRNASGDGPWSAGLNFVVGALPGTATLVTPHGIVDIALPTYVWTAVAGAADYYLWVNGPAGTPVIQAHYDAATSCGESTTCVASPDVVLADGAHTWWIQARNESGDGPWSAATGFTVAASGVIAAGTGSSYAVTRSGELWAWGLNESGQLGDGTNDYREVSTMIPGLTGIVAISAGANHVVALKHDGTVWTWGGNEWGQLGHGGTDAVSVPTQVAGLTDVIAVSAGWTQTFALRRDGTVWGWGANQEGQLGDGTADDRFLPVQIEGLVGIKAIAAGWLHGLALKSDGTVWTWGEQFDGTEPIFAPVQKAGLSDVVSVHTGFSAGHSFARTAAGRLFAWGLNGTGELGIGSTENQPTPVEVPGLANVREVWSGGDHTVALLADGTVWTFGLNAFGELGDGTTEDRWSPVQVPGLAGIAHVSAGWFYSMALGANGTVYTWGDNTSWQLGNGTSATALTPVSISEAGFYWKAGTPTFIPSSGTYSTDQTVVLYSPTPSARVAYTTNGLDPTESDPSVLSELSIVVSAPGTVKARAFAPRTAPSDVSSATYAFKVGTPIMSPPGSVYATAQNVTLTTVTADAEIRYTMDGSEPTGSSALYTAPIPIAATTILRARAFRASWQDSETAEARYTIGAFGHIAAGGGHTLLLRPDGTLMAWGGNWAGQVGDGTNDARPTAVAIDGLTGVTAIAAGDTHSVALRSDGTVWTWGVNDRGNLGTGSTENSAVPVLVPGLTDVIAISAGGRQTYAVKADGTAWAWGSNDFGELGNGIAVDQLAPFQIPGLEGVTAIAGGLQHALALKNDGTVWRWGGDPAAVPAQVEGLAGVNLIASGFSALHDFARTEDGRVWGWGNNDVGELGNGTTGYENVPVELTAFAGAQVLSAGFGHSLFVKADGTVWATGWNVKGQIGDGTTEDRLTPVQVAGLTDMVAVSASWYSSLALKADGTVYGWGDNSNSQLGNGDDHDALSPVTAAFNGPAATPTFSVPTGTYSTDQTVTLVSATPGAVIRYSDADDVTTSDPFVPSGGSVVISEPQTLWARTFAPGYGPSESVAATYEFKVGTPAFAPPPGSYTPSVSLSTVTTNAEIRYTTDGSEATAESALYAAPIPLVGTTTIRARAFRAGWQDSDEASAVYAIATPQVAGGFGFSLALDGGGRVWSWGDNSSGQLGLGTDTSHPRPLPVPGLANVAAISAGAEHALVLDGAGAVRGWGANWYGQLGLAGGIYYSPISVPGLPAITAVAAGGDYSLALDGAGSVWAWGGNYSGQLGDGTTSTRSSPGVIPGLGTATAIAAGAAHALALRSDGTVLAWGNNVDGQVGNGAFDTAPVTSPVVVGGLSDVTAIAAGAAHSLALRSDGTVWFWGYRDTTPEGVDLRELTPVQVPGLTDVVKIAAGGLHSLAIKSDGTVWAWGQNWAGQLGNGTFDSATPTPVPVSFLADAVAVGAGLAHSLAVTSDGRVWAWGDSTQGQIGDGSVETVRTEPTAITDPAFGWRTPAPTLDPPAGTYVARELQVTVACEVPGTVVHYRTDVAPPTVNDPAVDCGGTITVASSLTLTVAGWYEGRRSETVTAAYILASAQVAAGARHFLYLDQAHALWAWGENALGQLGNGTTTDASEPVAVPIEGVAEVAVGGRHSLALKADGTVWAWGDNAKGQLGRAGGASSSPVPVEGLPASIIAISAGDAHSLALASDGTVWAWGDNGVGQLGTDPSDGSSTPAVVPGLTGVVQIAAGLRHNLARTGGGAVWAWGDNTLGQLGEGSLDPHVGPVQTGFSDAISIAAGDDHSLAISSDRRLLGWGDNRRGQFTMSNYAAVTFPEEVYVGGGEGGGEGGGYGLGDVALADGGARHTSATGVPSGLETWGEGMDTGSPRFVLDAPIARLSAAGDNNLAVSRDGVLWYWTYGANASSQAIPLTAPTGEFRVFPPSFSVPAGTHSTELSVTITARSGATIHYTTDDTTPDETSPVIASGSAVSITRSTVLQAIAIVPGQLPSGVRRSEYTLVVPTPVVTPGSGGQDAPFVATVTEADPLAEVTYGINAFPSVPIASGGTVALTPPTDFYVRATREGWTESFVSLSYPLGVVTPTITPAGGHFTEPVTVTISTTTPGVSLFYLFGDEYVWGDTQVGTPIESGSTIVIDHSTGLIVKGFRDGLAASNVAFAQFYFALPAPTITVARESRPDGAFYLTGASVTPGATVRCTTDGTEPNFASPVCNRPTPIDTSVTVKAKAYKVGWDPSPTVTRTVTVTGSVVSTPRFSLEAGRYPSRRSVVVTASTSSAVIHYTTNGADPTASDAIVASGGSVLVDHSLILKARAFVGSDKSLAASADYELTGQVVASDFVLALKTDGTLWSWGNNDSDQTGLGAGHTLYADPTMVGIDSVIAIAAGPKHSLALRADGTVWTWGLNEWGQLGLGGDPFTVDTPTMVDITDVKAIVAGLRFSAALKADGTLWAWGESQPGSVEGEPSFGFGFTPHQIPGRQCVRIYAAATTLVCIDPLGRTWFGGTSGFERPPEYQGLVAASDGSDLFVLLGNGGSRGLPRSTSGTGRIGLSPSSLVSRDLVLGPMSQAWKDTNNFYDPGDILARPLHEVDPVVAIDTSTMIGADGSLWRWGPNTFYEVGDPADNTVHPYPFLVPGMTVFTQPWLLQDSDDDGLSNVIELDLGTDPYDADTNDDGIGDGAAVAAGRDPISVDLDGDGLSNADEVRFGTDMLNADSDGDGVIDGLDVFPLDPSRSAPATADPGDTTPPDIILTRPAAAVLVSSVP